ncbi:hypothetical protein CEXT_728951 [Caerostris extrusa]|uniref:Uncharacterized protein n=1 Tax=Caerostris extrusa TaxID=172846 RepID=A0AAV4R595_CAEEX|nr:hypothetical protein CEXT_728951 [Caerostris extrusa]
MHLEPFDGAVSARGSYVSKSSGYVRTTGCCCSPIGDLDEGGVFGQLPERKAIPSRAWLLGNPQESFV